ncbi:MAG: PAS domain S-box protein, partial [Anaerolineae bacterium]
MSKDRRESNELKERLVRAEAELEALRRGEVDTVVGPDAIRVVRDKSLVEEKERLSREWQTTFDAVKDAIFILDADQRILRCNRAAEKLFERTGEELLGKHCWEIVHGTAEPIPECPILRMRQSLQRETIDLSMGDRWFEVAVDPVLDAENRLTGAVHIMSDITDRKQAEEALKESEENLRITLNSIGDAVITTDTNGKVTGMNPVAETLTGWKIEEAEGKPLTDVFCIINDQTREPVENPVEKVLKAGKVVGLANHTVLVSKDGAEYQIADSGAPIQNATGRITGVVLVFRDVTEQLRAEQELLKVKKLESVGVLAGGIAHDFNNLLTGLLGNIEMAKMFLSADHKSYQFLESAGRSMESATNLTKQLLTFAKGGDPIKETIAIGEVITETARFSLRGSNVKLQSNIAPNLWLVDADKGQLSQVISNLVINAQQAMPAGGTITIAAENVGTSEGRYVKFTVQDEGVGIAAQYLDKIFDPYFSTKQKGSGLGLASTHSIISKHNGTITVDSQLNQGTIFTIHLPATEKKEETAGKFPVETTITAVSSARILVMDDEEVVRDVIGAMLETLGHKV